VALTGTIILVAFNVSDDFLFIHRAPRATDFYLYYLAAQIAHVLGMAQAYNPMVFLPALMASSGRSVPYLNPPLVAWLVTPLTALPFETALTVWRIALAGSALLTWRLAAPGTGLRRWAHLSAAASIYILYLGFRLGQVTLIVVAALAVCWWLIRHNRPLLAGVVLAAITLKPQFAFLVPLTLLAAGYWRVFSGFLLTAVPLTALSLLAMGGKGIHDFLTSSTLAHDMVGVHQVTVLNAVGWLPLVVAVAAASAIVALITAYRSRRHGPELPMAAGIIGTLLVSPYINGFDLAALALAAWLVLRTNPPTWQKALLVAGYLDLALYVVTGVGLTIAFEFVWLMSLPLLIKPHGHRVRTFPTPTRGRSRRVVVLPAYRAEKTLREVLSQIPRAEVDRILLVDDASSDHTAELALDLGVDVIKHPKNLGYGGNQKTCYTNALLMGADVVVMLHPDGQYDPSLVPSLCRAVEDGCGDLVMGSRWLGLDPAAAGMPSWKRLGNRVLTWAENQVLGLNLSEYHTGYRAYSRRFLETVPFAENSDDFVFDTQVLVQAAAFGFQVHEIPAVGRYFADASSIGLRTSVVYGVKTLTALARFVANGAGLPCPWLTPHERAVTERRQPFAA
jgi:hypothetical protein